MTVCRTNDLSFCVALVRYACNRPTTRLLDDQTKPNRTPMAGLGWFHVCFFHRLLLVVFAFGMIGFRKVPFYLAKGHLLFGNS